MNNHACTNDYRCTVLKPTCFAAVRRISLIPVTRNRSRRRPLLIAIVPRFCRLHRSRCYTLMQMTRAHRQWREKNLALSCVITISSTSALLQWYGFRLCREFGGIDFARVCVCMCVREHNALVRIAVCPRAMVDR